MMPVILQGMHFALLGYVSGIFIFILLEQTNAKDKN